MLSQKIVRLFCLGVIFSFLSLAATLAQDQEPLTNTDSRTVFFTKASPHSFKGIDPPFPPPKYEFLMSSKRTLVFMEIDQATDTKFSLVRVVGGLPGGIPCVGGVNWPRGYEIVGEVPADIDLTNDTIAKSLVERGRTALFNFCPEASTTETLTVWLFKDEIPMHQSHNYEVYASWETQLPAAPGPRIKAEYHNQALECTKRLVESRVKKVAPTRRSSTLSDPSPNASMPTISFRQYVHMKAQEFFSNYGWLIICVVIFLLYLLIKATRQTATSESSSGGYSSYDSDGGCSSYDYSEPDSRPIFKIFKTTCPVCGGDGKCQNSFHPDGLLESVFVGAMTDLLSPHGCPACGRNTEDPGKCSTCGGSGEVY